MDEKITSKSVHKNTIELNSLTIKVKQNITLGIKYVLSYKKKWKECGEEVEENK